MWRQGGMLKNLDRLVVWRASLNHVDFHSGNKLMKRNTRFRAFSATKHTRTK